MVNKDKWSALSLKDRAELINIYVKAGITDLDRIIKDYNSFSDGGSMYLEPPLEEELLYEDNGMLKINTPFYSTPKKEETFVEKTTPKIPLRPLNTVVNGPTIGDPNAPYVELPEGIVDITRNISKGSGRLYSRTARKGEYYRDPYTGNIYERAFIPKEGVLDTSKLERLSYKDVRSLLPKRDYIGGTPHESRMKALNMNLQIKTEIERLADIYGIDKNVLMHRFTKEGWIDKQINNYNKGISTEEQKDFFKRAVKERVYGFTDLGLDDSGSLIPQYNLRRSVPYQEDTIPNEKGRFVNSAIFDNLYDGLEVKAADMEYRKNALTKRGISDDDINTYINAAYNLGLYHKDLNDEEWIKQNYTVPNYFKSGGLLKTSSNDEPKGKGTSTYNHPKYNEEEESHIYSYLREKGVPHVQSVAIMGNIAVESLLNPHISQIGGGGGYGLIQATDQPRKNNFINYDGQPYEFGSKLDPETQRQLDYIIDKGLNTYTIGEWKKVKGTSGARDARKKFLSESSVDKASDLFTRSYLRPGKPHKERRQSMSMFYDEKYKNPFEVGILFK